MILADTVQFCKLKFQKRLRLREARRLMLGEGLDAASAAYRVGYHDASYFKQEYKASLAYRRCETWNDYGKLPGKASLRTNTALHSTHLQ